MKSFSFLLSSLESELIFRNEASPLCLDKIESFDPSEELSNYLVFADEEFNIGIAWYCEDELSGSIYRVDPEYGSDAEFINSSIKRFNDSISVAAEWSANHNSKEVMMNPNLIDDLYHNLLKIDPKAFESSKYHWPSLIDHIKVDSTDYDEEMEFKFEIT